jgi:hypothetical protein
MPFAGGWGWGAEVGAASENLQGTKPRADAGSGLVPCAYGDLSVTRFGL